MVKTFTLSAVSLVLAASLAGGCSDDEEDPPPAAKTCADLQACCDKVTDADKKKNCQSVHDALKGVQNADLGCEQALKTGWQKECP